MLDKIKSKYIFKQLFKILNKKRLLQLIKINKQLNKLLNIILEDYKKFVQIIFELTLTENVIVSNLSYGAEKIRKYIHYYKLDSDIELKHNKHFVSNQFKIVIDYEVNSLDGFFNGESKIREIKVIKWNNINIIDLSFMFYGCTSLTNIHNLSIIKTENVKNMCRIFQLCTSLKELDLSNFKTTKVKDMNNMFSKCRSLNSLNVSSFDTKNVINMSSMFLECQLIKELDLSNFDTSNVNDISYMFFGCTNLSIINISNFNTRKITKMCDSFYKCINLDKLDLSNFDTNNVDNMYGLFSKCASLKDLNVSGFKTDKVINFQNMFSECTSLINIDISHFIFNNKCIMVGMFNKCSSDLVLKVKAQNNSLKDEAFTEEKTEE